MYNTEHTLSNRSGHSEMENTDKQGEFPGRRVLEDIGTGDGVPIECERCGKRGSDLEVPVTGESRVPRSGVRKGVEPGEQVDVEHSAQGWGITLFAKP